ncbi:hypothetical protein ACFE04_022094 [Oxalis oulophora]
MGNCLCNHSSSRLVAPAPPTSCCDDKASEPIEKENLKSSNNTASCNSTSSSSGRSKKKKEVTIKMTKRQLEELLCRVDVNDQLTVEQVLVQIMMNANNADDDQISQSSWKPALQSIPE